MNTKTSGYLMLYARKMGCGSDYDINYLEPELAPEFGVNGHGATFRARRISSRVIGPRMYVIAHLDCIITAPLSS